MIPGAHFRRFIRERQRRRNPSQNQPIVDNDAPGLAALAGVPSAPLRGVRGNPGRRGRSVCIYERSNVSAGKLTACRGPVSSHPGTPKPPLNQR